MYNLIDSDAVEELPDPDPVAVRTLTRTPIATLPAVACPEPEAVLGSNSMADAVCVPVPEPDAVLM